MNATHHDRILAMTSHIPQLIAYSIVALHLLSVIYVFGYYNDYFYEHMEEEIEKQKMENRKEHMSELQKDVQKAAKELAQLLSEFQQGKKIRMKNLRF